MGIGFFFSPPWFSANVKPFNISRAVCLDVSQSWTMFWTLPVRLHPTVSDCSQTQMFCSQMFSVSCTRSEIGAVINVMYDLQSCSDCLRNAGLLSSLLLLLPLCSLLERAVLTHSAVCLSLKEQQSNYPQFSSFCLEIKCGSGRNITRLCKINELSGILLLSFIVGAVAKTSFQFSLEMVPAWLHRFHFPERFRARWQTKSHSVKAGFISNQSECRWCHHSIANTLCYHHLLDTWLFFLSIKLLIVPFIVKYFCP